MISLFLAIVNFTNSRVIRHGSQYVTYGIFAIINHPFAYFSVSQYHYSNQIESFPIRFIATLLGLILIFSKQWPEKLKKYLPLYSGLPHELF